MVAAAARQRVFLAWLAATLLAASGVAAQNQAAPAVALPAPPLTVADGEAIEHALLAASEFPFPAQLAGAANALASPDANLRIAAADALAKAAINLAREEHGRLTDPAAVDPNWALRSSYDPEADFAAARAQGRLVAWAQGLPRRDAGYIDLLNAWRRYEVIAEHGGWRPLPAGAPTKPGDRGRFVLILRARLASEGYGAAEPTNRAYDHALAAEVAEFQRRHGLTPTAKLDAKTVAAMNVPAQTRLDALEANLERARWLPEDMPPDRIDADVAAATVTLFRAGQSTLSMRAVVGDTGHPTPLFASHVSSIEFNPPWHVPADIAKAELWPKQARSPGYFASHGYSVVDGQVVQHAGPKSALGRVKFEMPNPFSVYLHDTPGKALFTVDARGRSHGCVRLERPKDLAAVLLGWPIEKVQAAIDSGVTHWVRPAIPVQVFLIYRTVVATDSGPATFLPDPYGWDAKLDAALAQAG